MPGNTSSPSGKLPIYIIGAGGIVNTAHLPAYKLAGYDVQGIFDVNFDRAKTTADNFNVPHVFGTLYDMISHAPKDVVFDVAVPGFQTIPTMEHIPDGASVLLQKPMGENFSEAIRILELARAKKMNAGINFQLRYAPYILAAKKIIQKNQLGTLNDIEINVNVNTPWHLWDFLASSPRLEILYHSIHYIDLVRNLLGNPESIYAKTTRHPSMPLLASVRSSIIMDYGEMIRANILTNHCHMYGTPKQHSYIKIEGTNGAIKINFGALIDYPRGAADSFEYVLLNDSPEPKWRKKRIKGSWFPDAFIGSMAQVMMAAEGKVAIPDNSVEDCIHTMACVESAYESSEAGGVKMKQV